MCDPTYIRIVLYLAIAQASHRGKNRFIRSRSNSMYISSRVHKHMGKYLKSCCRDVYMHSSKCFKDAKKKRFLWLYLSKTFDSMGMYVTVEVLLYVHRERRQNHLK